MLPEHRQGAMSGRPLSSAVWWQIRHAHALPSAVSLSSPLPATTSGSSSSLSSPSCSSSLSSSSAASSSSSPSSSSAPSECRCATNRGTVSPPVDGSNCDKRACKVWKSHRLPLAGADSVKGSRSTWPSWRQPSRARRSRSGARREARWRRIAEVKEEKSSPEPQLGSPVRAPMTSTRADSWATKTLARSTASLGASSRPGSHRRGSSFSSDWIDSNTFLRDKIALHLGPCHVPSMLRQTFPSAYNCGWMRKVPPSVLKNFTCGGLSG
mmetsp:Transcript_123953/g.309818  ORF Transcript_123953/g.309818 Transcript_123953/m.309818 type:complete len:268 (+) Transcript_123953:1022-1825(+)